VSDQTLLEFFIALVALSLVVIALAVSFVAYWTVRVLREVHLLVTSLRGMAHGSAETFKDVGTSIGVWVRGLFNKKK
jgi:hypothetical protein